MYYSQERTTRMAARLFDHVRAGTTDQTAGLMHYDTRIFSDPVLAERERDLLFRRLPMMAAHASQLPGANSFLVVALNESSVLLVRDQQGKVAAFLNVCRHRGAKLVTETAGVRPRFTCGYHGWSYTNEGRHIGISFADTFGSRPCGDTALIPLPVEERHGFIWVVEDPEGHIDVAGHLGPDFDQALAEYSFDAWHCYREGMFDFPQNWKIMVDGLIDGYHVKFLHGDTISPYFHHNIMAFEIFGDHALWVTPRKAIDDILDEPPGQSSLEKYAIFGNFISVNAALVLHPHHVEFWTIYQDPLDLRRCRVHLRHLTPNKVLSEKGQEIMAKNWKIATDAILNEDVPMGDSIQASSASPFAGRSVLGRNEVANQLFHSAYQRHMGI